MIGRTDKEDGGRVGGWGWGRIRGMVTGDRSCFTYELSEPIYQPATGENISFPSGRYPGVCLCLLRFGVSGVTLFTEPHETGIHVELLPVGLLCQHFCPVVFRYTYNIHKLLFVSITSLVLPYPNYCLAKFLLQFKTSSPPCCRPRLPPSPSHKTSPPTTQKPFPL